MQELIANYLDDRCSKIDAIIAEAKASIEEYKELKQAVIYEAVTKGLDKNVEMKTYNDWFDMCPANWKYEQIRYLYELRDERNFDPLSEVNLISLYTDRGVMQHSDIEKTSGNKKPHLYLKISFDKGKSSSSVSFHKRAIFLNNLRIRINVLK